jgi:hypothetical protein
MEPPQLIARENLQRVAEGDEDTYNIFQTVDRAIGNSIGRVVDPGEITGQVSNFIEAPARSRTFQALVRIQVYAQTIDTIINGIILTQNALRLTLPYVFGSVAGSVLSAVNNVFETAPDVFEAADAILAQLDQVTAWSDEKFADLDAVDVGEAYQALQEAVALAAGYLVQVSFTTAREFKVVLNRNRSVIDLCAEVYGDPDEKLDFFIETNNFTGSELITIPAGREVVYYV